MTSKRQIEIFSAGCPTCQDTIDLVNNIACSSCEITILDMNNDKTAKRAKLLGIKAVPAVVINGKLADCCTGSGVDEASLRSAGVGEARACCS